MPSWMLYPYKELDMTNEIFSNAIETILSYIKQEKSHTGYSYADILNRVEGMLMGVSSMIPKD